MSLDDLSPIRPPQSDDALNDERSQCDELLGGATLRLVNAWDPGSAADHELRKPDLRVKSLRD